MHNPFTPTITVDETFHEKIEAAQEGQYAVIVKPPEDADTDPRTAAENIFRAIHSEVESVSMEIHQLPSGRIEFWTVAESREQAVLLHRRILAIVEGDVEIVEASLPIAADEHLAGARIEYARDQILPLQTTKSYNDDTVDPYTHLLKTMADETDARAVIQFVLKPVDYSRPFEWGYRLLQLYDERIEPTWTTRWSRWKPPALMTDRRPRKPSVEIASMVSLIMYVIWIVIGNNPIAALPSIQFLDAVIPATTVGPVPGFGPLHVPADLSTFVFGPPEPIDLAGKVSYAVMMIVVGSLYFTAWAGDGIQELDRRNADTQADLAREKGDNDDRRASRAERETAESISQQGRDIAYRVNARVLTISEDAASAGTYRNRLVKQFENSWRETATKQRLRATTIGRFGHVHHRLPRFLSYIVERKSTRTRWFWIQKMLVQGKRRKPMYMAPFEVAALAHWPIKSASNIPAIEYAIPMDTEELFEGEDDFERVEELEEGEPDAPTDVEELPEDEPSQPDSPSPPGEPSPPEQPPAKTDGGADPDQETETDDEDAEPEPDDEDDAEPENGTDPDAEQETETDDEADGEQD